GLECDYFYYDEAQCNIPNLGTMTPSHSALVDNLYMESGNFPNIQQTDNFCQRCKGFLRVQQEGSYKFYTTSDDGSNLYLNGEKIVDNDGCHGRRERSSSSKLLSSGAHELIVDFCEAGGGERLYVHYEGPDTSNSKVTIPKEDLKHRKAHPQGWGGECFFAARWRARPQCKLLNKCPAVAPAEIEVSRET
ncbi:unnamed protein product, partial [Symbiodinium sp. KB8]